MGSSWQDWSNASRVSEPSFYDLHKDDPVNQITLHRPRTTDGLADLRRLVLVLLVLASIVVVCVASGVTWR